MSRASKYHRSCKLAVSVTMPVPMVEAMEKIIQVEQRRNPEAPINQSAWIRQLVQRQIDALDREQKRAELARKFGDILNRFSGHSEVSQPQRS